MSRRNWQHRTVAIFAFLCAFSLDPISIYIRTELLAIKAIKSQVKNSKKKKPGYVYTPNLSHTESCFHNLIRVANSQIRLLKITPWLIFKIESGRKSSKWVRGGTKWEMGNLKDCVVSFDW